MDNSDGNGHDSEEASLMDRVVKWDKRVSRRLALCSSAESAWGHLRPCMRVLEYACHGVPWFLGVASLLLMSHQFDIQQKLLNLFCMLLLDVLVVGLTKAAVGRHRPAENTRDSVTISFDVYSFPSGHASRSFMLATFLPIHFHIDTMWTCVIWLWAVSVAASRVLLGRHYVNDVVAGTVIGCLLCPVVNCCNLWLSPDLCKYIIRPIQEEFHL